jgi:hypothetical protein
MKISHGILLALLAGSGIAAQAQPVYSRNIVGYFNTAFYAGDNLFANQLAIADNSLNTIFQHSTVPEGTTFTEWDSAAQQYLPASVYDASSGWSINYLLGYGQGGLLDATAAFTNTFVGEVWPGYDLSGPFVPPLVSSSGMQLLSCVVPLEATFNDVVGRDPLNGESVTTLDASSQTYTTSTYDDGVWSNGAPLLEVGQAAFFDLGNGAVANNVPEPASSELAGIGLFVLTAARRFIRRA